jgi:hypothetical protein
MHRVSLQQEDGLRLLLDQHLADAHSAATQAHLRTAWLLARARPQAFPDCGSDRGVAEFC